MGKIIKFPIHVENTRANESVYGILNILRPSVRPDATAATDATVSEKGLWASLSAISAETSGVNQGPGMQIFVSGNVSTGSMGNVSDIYYRSLNSSSPAYFTVTENLSALYLGTDQADSINLVDMKYFNGGIEQEASNIEASDFINGDSKVLLKNIDARIAIGKVVLICNTPFTYADGSVTGDIIYSIGTTANPSGIVSSIDTASMVAGDLASFTYGNLMGDKVQYANYAGYVPYTYFNDESGNITGEVSGTYVPFSSYNLVEHDDIRMFISRPSSSLVHSAGDMDCLIFYDMSDRTSPVTVRNDIVMFGGQTEFSTSDDWGALDSEGSATHAIQRYDTVINMGSVESMTLTEPNCRYGLMRSSSKMYMYGGMTDYSKNTVFRIDMDSRTVSVVDTSNALLRNFKGAGCETRVNGYVFGGGDETAPTEDHLKFNYATETGSVLNSSTVTGYDIAVFRSRTNDITQVNDTMFFAGGRTAQDTMVGTSLTRFVVMTETFDTGGGTIGDSAYSMGGCQNASDSFLVAGHKYAGAAHSTTNKIYKYSFATASVALVDPRLIVNLGDMSVCSDSDGSHMYLMGGIDKSGTDISEHVLSVNTVNYTSQFINTMTYPVIGAKSGNA